MTGILLLFLFALPDDDRRDALARYGVGVLKQGRDQLVSAQMQYEAAAKADPTSTTPLRALIPVYLDLGRDPAAERAARKVLDLDPDDAITGLALGKMLLAAKKPADAAVVLEKASHSPRLGADPATAVDVLHEWARAAGDANDSGATESAVQRRADLLIAQRNPIARSTGLSLAEADALTALTFERLGTVRMGRKDWAGAAEAFGTAHKLYRDPKGANDPSGAARLDRNLARVAAAKGDPAEAVKRQASFLTTKPPGLAPLVDYAKYLREAGRDSAAEFERLVEANPRSERLKWLATAERGRAGFATTSHAKENLIRFANNSTDPELFDLIAEFFVAAGRPEDAFDWAEQAFNAAKGEPPGSAKQRRMALVAESIAGNKTLAETIVLHSSIQIRSGNRRSNGAWEFVAWLGERTGKSDLADEAVLAHFRTRTDDLPPELFYRVFRVLERRGQYEEILSACDRIDRVTANKYTYSVQLAGARALADLGRDKDALTALTAAGRGDFFLDWKLDLRCQMLEVLVRLGRYDRAAEEGEKLLAEQTRAGDVAQVRYILSTAYLGLKQHDKAEAALRAVLEADPDDILALNNLGYHLADEGRKLPEAEGMIRRAIELNRDERARAGNPVPENGVYLDSLGWVLFRRGKLMEAKAVFEKAVSYPDGAADPVVWDHFGDVLFKLGEKEKARAAWKKAEPGYAVGHKGREGGRKEELKRKLDLFP